MIDKYHADGGRIQRCHIGFVIDGEMKQALDVALATARAKPLSGQTSQSAYLRGVLVEHLHSLVPAKLPAKKRRK